MQNKEPTNETLLSINNGFDTTKQKRVAMGTGKKFGKGKLPRGFQNRDAPKTGAETKRLQPGCADDC